MLVVWDISSGRRTYLPRLGSRLRNIAQCSGDPSRVAVSLEDNVVRMVRGRSRETRRGALHAGLEAGWLGHAAALVALRLPTCTLPLPPSLPLSIPQVDLATMSIQASVRGICCAPATSVDDAVALAPGAGHLALLSAAGSLQFYDPVR